MRNMLDWIVLNVNPGLIYLGLLVLIFGTFALLCVLFP